MRQFIIKMSGIVMLLASVLLVESFVMGDLSLLGALALIPACGMAAWKLLLSGARAKERRHRARSATGAWPARVPARARQRGRAVPALRVVEGGGHGPRAA